MSLSIPQPFVPALWHLVPCVSGSIHTAVQWLLTHSQAGPGKEKNF